MITSIFDDFSFETKPQIDIIIPVNKLICDDTLRSNNKENSLTPLPPPSFELFEHIGSNEIFYEKQKNTDFAELLILLFPRISNSSILFFQKGLNNLILTKTDTGIINEFFISKTKEPHNKNKINASIGAIHYFYLLYYNWLFSCQNLKEVQDYEIVFLKFFSNYLATLSIVDKFNLSQQIKYTPNLFSQQVKTQELYYDLIQIGQYIKEYIDSKFVKNSHLFRIKLEDYEVEYLKIVQKFIDLGLYDLGKNEDFNITSEQLHTLINSFLIEKYFHSNGDGLWKHNTDVYSFISHLKKYDLLKELHKISKEKEKNNSSEDGGATGGRRKI